MEPFTRVSGIAAPLLAANIDTDVIMPKQFLKGIDRQGLDKGVFYDLRFHPDGSLNPEFILNRPAWMGASFLVTGPNFGCGSSREHAVWGMKQLGIRALIGTTFAGIFYDNCQRNGVLIISLQPETHRILADLVSKVESNRIIVDLQDKTVETESGGIIEFEIEPLRRELLINGLDSIAKTFEKRGLIADFEQRHLEKRPWLIP